MFPPCPQPPDWSIDWATLDQLPWLQDMRGCPQNSQRHAEGDVWVHVHLVTEAMVALPAWRQVAGRRSTNSVCGGTAARRIQAGLHAR